jgi:hypothetical protein
MAIARSVNSNISFGRDAGIGREIPFIDRI